MDEYISCIYVTARLALLKSLPTESITDVEDIVALVCHKPIFIEKDKIEQNVREFFELAYTYYNYQFHNCFLFCRLTNYPNL